MPVRLLRAVESRTLAFLMPVQWAKLGIFSFVDGLYGIRGCLTDLRLSNVASLIAVHEKWADVRSGTARSLARWRRRCAALVHPALSWKAAYVFYYSTVSETYPVALQRARRQRGDQQHLRIYGILYAALKKSEAPMWDAYVTNRLNAKDWVGELFARHAPCAGLPPSRALLVSIEAAPQCTDYHLASSISKSYCAF